MPPLHELLSDLSREILADHILEVGGIYHKNFTVNDGITPKYPGETSRNKFFVVIGIDSEQNLMGYLFINSDINQNFGVDFENLQHELLSEKYGFLDKNSFLDCSKILSMKRERFAEALKRGKCGQLTREDLDIVTALLTVNHSVKKLRKFNISI